MATVADIREWIDRDRADAVKHEFETDDGAGDKFLQEINKLRVVLDNMPDGLTEFEYQTHTGENRHFTLDGRRGGPDGGKADVRRRDLAEKPPDWVEP
jgi:hypothetical protein